MTITINAIDSQFAASTGSNVNSSPNKSKFDYPPTSTMNLTIESHEGDDSPYIFSPGDTYTVSFMGNSGGTIQDATVIRSDLIDGGPGHAIVFEGLDDNGDLMQVVWTPEYDLEAWYFDNFTNGNAPEFHNTDMDASTAYQAVCFEGAMRIDTPSGPRCAKSIRPGDFVMTHDGGAKPVKWVAHRHLRAWGRHAPVVFADGAIGNQGELVLSQQHRVLIHAPEAFKIHGSDAVLVPAVAFANGATVRVTPRRDITYVHLLLEQHHILTAQGVACESLLLGKVSRELIERLPEIGTKGSVQQRHFDEIRAFGAFEKTDISMSVQPARPCLTLGEGMRLIARINRQPYCNPKTLVGPGRSRLSPYHLRVENGLKQWCGDQEALPAFALLSVRELEPVH